MKQKIRTVLAVFGLVLGMSALVAPSVGAINVFDKGCSAQDATTAVCSNQSEAINTPIQNIIGTLLMAVGIVAVIMIIVGGLRYILSNGDASKIKSAKDTVLYSVIGLIVAMLAYAIVNFAVAQF